MKRTSLLASVLALRALGPLFAGATLLCGAGLERTPRVIRLVKVGSGRYLAAGGVSLNGKGSYRFLIDTGSSSSALEPDAARELGIQPTYAVLVESVAGAGTAPAARVSLCITNVCHDDSEVILSQLPAVKEADSRVRGILGMDFLMRSGFVLDNSHRELRIGPVVPEHQGAVVPLVRVGERLAVRARRGENGDSITLIIDSGTQDLVLFSRGGRTSVAGRQRAVEVATNFGAQSGIVEKIPELRLGSYVVRKLTAVVIPFEPGVDPMRGDGLIPASLFETVVFHPSGAYAVIGKGAKGGRQ